MAALINTGVSRTAIEDKLKKFDNIITVSKAEHGDFVCSDYTSDDQCIQAALDYISGIGGGTLYIQKGNYNCAAQIPYTGSNLVVYGDGDNTILDFTNCTTQSCIYVHGAISATNSLLTVAADAGDITITVADGTKFDAGDWIRIRSEAIFQYSNEWNQKFAEIQKIKSINGNVLTLDERVLGSYALVDTATADLVTMLENISFHDFKIVCSAANSNYGIDIRQTYNAKVSNVSFEDVRNRAVHYQDVVSGQYKNNLVLRSNLDPLGYGLAVLNASRDIIGYGNRFYDCRHGIACGGGNSYGIQYNQVYTNNTQSHCSQHDGMFGPHPTADGIIIANNSCIGCGLGYVNCINAIVSGNVVKNTESGYVSFYLSDCSENVIVVGNIFEGPAGIKSDSRYSNISIIGNQIKCTASGVAGIVIGKSISNLFIHNNFISSSGSPIYISNLNVASDSSDITITGNELIWTEAPAGIDILGRVYNYNNVHIDGNKLRSSASGVGIRISKSNGDSGVNSSISISNNKYYGAAAGIAIKYSEKISIDSNKIYSAAIGIIFDIGCTKYSAMNNVLDSCTQTILDSSDAIGRVIYNNPGYNPVGNFTAPTLPATTTAYTNNYGYPCRVSVSGGTVTEITLDSIATGLTSGAFVIPIGGTIAITYSSAPTWKWWGL